jgi:hypothetical protein
MQTMKPNSSKLLHITIGTHPTKDSSLANEINLVIAALLYADKVKLYSLKTSAISMASRLGDMPINLQLTFIEKVIPFLNVPDKGSGLLSLMTEYKKILGRKHLSSREIQAKKRLEEIFESSWTEIKQTAQNFIDQSKIDQLNKAIQTEILELHKFKGTDQDTVTIDIMVENVAAAVSARLNQKTRISSQDESWMHEFVENICETVSNGSTYPLFDELTGKLVSKGIKEKIIDVSNSGIDRGKQVGLATQLFERLPLFEKASIDEILDIRRELEKPLIRFRSAIIRFSEDIKATSWDKDFVPESEKVFYREVAPTILEIEEVTKSNQFLASLVRKFVDKPLTLGAGSALSIALSQIPTLPHEIAFSLGIGLSSAAIIYDTYEEWKKKQQTTEQNLLYFYYKAHKHLTE